jgi:Astacin (Peptidase family M12A)
VEFIFDQNSRFLCVSQWIGRRGGRQTINILENCSFGTIQHEILHAVGVFHEHTRADRDEYIRVNWGNIRRDRVAVFQYRREHRTLSACPYDYGSIMHYPLQSSGFATDPNIDVLTPLRPIPPGVEIGQRDALSACDAAGLRFLYPGTRGCTIEEDPDLIVFLDQPAYEGLPLGYEQRIVTPTSFPANYINRPISIDVMQGWVAIITMYCDSEFPTELRVFRDEPNISLPGPVCRIEMVPVAEEKIINIPDFGRRCPMNHVRGDGEFAGNGPAIYSSATVWADLNNKIQLRVNFMAAEIGGDRSFVRDEWLRELMAIEPHLQVLAMDRSSSETAGEVPVDGLMLGFRSRPADFEVIVCNEGQVHTSGSDFQLRGDLIREMQIVGDTGFQDIRSGNCGCDTGIRNIIFNPVRVYLGARP